MSTPAERLITLIMLLEKQPNQKAADLAAQLGVSVRTLQRYMLMLDEMGIPIYSERGPNGGFSLVRGYKLPPLVFTPREAAALYLGANLAEEVLGQPVSGRGALRPDPARKRSAGRAAPGSGLGAAQSGYYRFAARGPRPDGPAAGNTAQCRPRAADGRIDPTSAARPPHPTRRSLDAYALVYRWGWWLRHRLLSPAPGLALLPPGPHRERSTDCGRFTRPRISMCRLTWKASSASSPVCWCACASRRAGAAIARHSRAYWHSLRELPDGSVEVEAWSP